MNATHMTSFDAKKSNTRNSFELSTNNNMQSTKYRTRSTMSHNTQMNQTFNSESFKKPQSIKTPPILVNSHFQ